MRTAVITTLGLALGLFAAVPGQILPIYSMDFATRDMLRGFNDGNSEAVVSASPRRLEIRPVRDLSPILGCVRVGVQGCMVTGDLDVGESIRIDFDWAAPLIWGRKGKIFTPSDHPLSPPVFSVKYPSRAQMPVMTTAFAPSTRGHSDDVFVALDESELAPAAHMPEPGAAVLFAAGLLAIRLRSGRRRS